MRIGVIGCGTVGLNTMHAFAGRGHEVVGFDVTAVAQQRTAMTFGDSAVAESLMDLGACDIAFECVPTDPLHANGDLDLTILEQVVHDFAALEGRSDYRCRVFCQRSTCPPGSARVLSLAFDVTEYAVNPSFLGKATANEDSIRPERVAIAGPPDAIVVLTQLYHDFPSPMFVSDSYEAVELLKFMENATDGVLISLWNEFLAIADDIGVSRHEFTRLIDAFVDRPRFATTVRVPGQAFGFWCLPKDLAALAVRYERLGTNVVRAAAETNDRVRERFGENAIPGSQLLHVEDGRVRLKAVARDYLSRVRHQP